MLQTVKRLVGAERGEPTPLDLARAEVDKARKELEAVQAAQAANVSRAREVFVNSTTDANADAVRAAEERSRLYIEAGTQKLRAAEAELTRLEAEAKAARIAELTRVIENVRTDVMALEPKTREAIQTLAAVIRERDDIVERAERAVRERAALRGDDYERQTWPATAGVNAARVLLRSEIDRAYTYDQRAALAALFISDGTTPGVLPVPPRMAP